MLQKAKNQLSQYAPLVFGLVIIALVTALGGLWHYKYEVASQKPAGQSVAGAKPNKLISASQASVASVSAKKSDPIVSKTGPSSLGQGATATIATTSGIAPVSAIQSSKISVSLSVNGTLKGSVSLPAGSNQCDILSLALANGIIGSLDMRYSAQYQTQAVYVIDGIGDPGTVWWTYKVNGKAPPYGCGAMTAHDGDQVSWQYVKN